MIGANILFLLLLDETVQAVDNVYAICNRVLEMCCRLQLKNNKKMIE